MIAAGMEVMEVTSSVPDVTSSTETVELVREVKEFNSKEPRLIQVTNLRYWKRGVCASMCLHVCVCI